MYLKHLARSKGTNVKRLAEECGVPASTLYAIASGNTNPGNVGIDLFLRISSALGMSAEELYRTQLMCQAEDGAAKTGDASGEDVREREIVDAYRRMNESGRQQLLVFARGCAVTYSA